MTELPPQLGVFLWCVSVVVICMTAVIVGVAIALVKHFVTKGFAHEIHH